jgi:iron complex transport system ATP-binding protein
MSVLSVKHLSVTAWGVSLLRDISLQLAAGEILAIIGPNGAGKSTLLNTLATYTRSRQRTAGETSGEIVACGYSLSGTAATATGKARHIAILPQISNLQFPFTVDEVVRLARIPHSTGTRIDNDIIEQALALLDIQHLKQRLYTQLSGGERQRVQLARVMAQVWRGEDAVQRLLLLDEPTSSLDLGHQQQLMDVISYFAKQGVGIVVVMHDINLALHCADHILALCCGEVIAHGSPKTVITPALMKQLYQVDVDVVQHPTRDQSVVMLANKK